VTVCTIVIPTHNRDDLLLRAVSSALAACPADGEVLVVDDKSAVAADQVLQSVGDDRLRVVSNTGESGAAHARNLGVALANGEVIFFLDDDDEMVDDYCSRVMSIFSEAGQEIQWGFAGTIERRNGVDRPRLRKRLQKGAVTLSASPRDLVAAMSDGFWMFRRLFLEIGGLDPELTIDEDTELCVRLVARRLCPWYEPSPGMIVYRGYIPARLAGSPLTLATSASSALRCYRRTHDKNFASFSAYSAMRWFLATRYLRRAVKGRQYDQAMDFVREQQPWSMSCLLAVFAYAKRLRHW
jgi:glycosyltransferase involved in cell wall biosynthesis